MLSRLHRFHGYNALSYAYKHGQVIRGAQLSLKYVPNKRRQTYRLAVVVSRKVDKSAVVRNRIRRRIFEIVRAAAEQITAPYDLVFTVFNGQLAELDSSELRQLVCSQLHKAGVLTPQRPKAASRAIVKPED